MLFPLFLAWQMQQNPFFARQVTGFAGSKHAFQRELIIRTEALPKTNALVSPFWFPIKLLHSKKGALASNRGHWASLNKLLKGGSKK